MNHDQSAERRPFLRTPIGLVLLGFLLIGAFLLVVEHQAHIFTGNWLLWLLPLTCVVMHFFHGGHGGHGSHSGGTKDRHDGGQPPEDRRGGTA
ncbi:MAG TPA: DUF2933 domain-containing protein [Vineibacter sp.]|nr:DUF2933 domain-containing protein [Vineibacter sp.]